MSEEDRSGITSEQFKEKFKVGTRVQYEGEEYILIKEEPNPEEPDNPVFRGQRLSNTPVTTFTLSEYQRGIFEIHPNPMKIPQAVEYPPQVLILAEVEDGGRVNVQTFKDLGALKAHNGIDGDAIMEAISDPGEPIHMDDGRTLILQSVESA